MQTSVRIKSIRNAREGVGEKKTGGNNLCLLRARENMGAHQLRTLQAASFYSLWKMNDSGRHFLDDDKHVPRVLIDRRERACFFMSENGNRGAYPEVY